MSDQLRIFCFSSSLHRITLDVAENICLIKLWLRHPFIFEFDYYSFVTLVFVTVGFVTVGFVLLQFSNIVDKRSPLLTAQTYNSYNISYLMFERLTTQCLLKLLFPEGAMPVENVCKQSFLSPCSLFQIS